ncbi:glycerate kinase [Clostridium bovifaecis]|uniref:Glycerate kinase n=1 Tax=Clostridium bovifaecis TaxID=2184719 RepID=A0A6I6ERP1_9CLOT|nr:glycerate kinase [Clostridium bovifaecis]
MRFVLAPDSFKESVTAREAAESMEKGIKNVMKDAECIKVPMADGGEGTVQSLVDATEGEIYSIEVLGPLGRTVRAEFGILGDEKTAVLEMASASGLHHVKREERNPLTTTTYGTGELIKAALDRGVKKIFLGIGGSATNDGGAGMIQALGGKFLTREGENIGFGGGALEHIHTIDTSGLDKRLKDVKIEVACDVSNPLTGTDGAAYVFGPQKGATHEVVEKLDANLKHYSRIIREQLKLDIENIPGAGAAGGLGAGLLAFLPSSLKRGVDLVIEYTGLEEKIKKADYVITGEGGIDFQTRFGKTPYGVASLAQKYNVPVIVIAGYIGNRIESLYDCGINSIFGILPGAISLEEALKSGKMNIERTTENIARLIAIK